MSWSVALGALGCYIGLNWSYLSVHPSTHLLIHPSIHPSNGPPIHPSNGPPIRPPIIHPPTRPLRIPCEPACSACPSERGALGIPQACPLTPMKSKSSPVRSSPNPTSQNCSTLALQPSVIHYLQETLTPCSKSWLSLRSPPYNHLTWEALSSVASSAAHVASSLP